jgi:hypothetical protein
MKRPVGWKLFFQWDMSNLSTGFFSISLRELYVIKCDEEQFLRPFIWFICMFCNITDYKNEGLDVMEPHVITAELISRELRRSNHLHDPM